MTFRDAHTHLAAGAADLADLDLRWLELEEVVSEVAREASRRPAGRWIRGWGWHGDASSLVGALDRAAPEHPVFAGRGDGHAAWVNSAAREALGAASEIVVEKEYETVRTKLPAQSTEERMIAVARLAHAFAQAGVVAVDDMIESWAVEVYTRLAARGELPLRVAMWVPDSIESRKAAAWDVAWEDPLSFAGVKIFVDGTLGARTAALFEPYADDPSTSGALRAEQEALTERVTEWAGRGFRLALHAIGDRAVDAALTALEAAPRSPAGPHRIEHAQVVRTIDLPRFAAAGIVASVQPLHRFDDAAFRHARLGDRPGVVAYPLASLARAGAKLVFGSDWPVSHYSPDAILRAATDAARGDEALAEADALAAMTAW